MEKDDEWHEIRNTYPCVARYYNDVEMERHDKKIILNFYGAYKFTGNNSVLRSHFAQSAGIYIWTIKDELHNVNYVSYIGETTNFAKRHREHFIQLTGFNYRIIDVEVAKRGIEKILWDGMWRDRSDNATDNLLAHYEALNGKAMELINYYDIYFAPTDVDKMLRKHIEGCLGWNLRRNHKNHTIFYPIDNHIGTSKQKYDLELVVNIPEEIAGIDSEQKL